MKKKKTQGNMNKREEKKKIKEKKKVSILVLFTFHFSLRRFVSLCLPEYHQSGHIATGSTIILFILCFRLIHIIAINSEAYEIHDLSILS